METVGPGEYAVIEVEDTGIGIPDEHLPRILEPLFTTQRPSCVETAHPVSARSRCVRCIGSRARSTC